MPEGRLSRTRESYRCALCGGLRLEGDHQITSEDTPPRAFCRTADGGEIFPMAEGVRPMNGLPLLDAVRPPESLHS